MYTYTHFLILSILEHWRCESYPRAQKLLHAVSVAYQSTTIEQIVFSTCLHATNLQEQCENGRKHKNNAGVIRQIFST